jgi:hypothetical protein
MVRPSNTKVVLVDFFHAILEGAPLDNNLSILSGVHLLLG